MVGKHMKDSNWQSTRQSILIKYDKNGDGIYDSDEVNAIVDDYMAALKNNAALIDTTDSMKKIIIFGAIMIILLSLSNLGTAFLAVNLAKEIRVSSDGTMTSADGSEMALKTLSKVSSVVSTEVFIASDDERRKLGELGKRGRYCFTAAEVLEIFETVDGGNSINAKMNLADGYLSIPIYGRAGRVPMEGLTVAADDFVTNYMYEYPDAQVKFEYKPNSCGDDGVLAFRFYDNVESFAVTWTGSQPSTPTPPSPSSPTRI